MISRLSLRLKALRLLLSNFSRDDKKVGENSPIFFCPLTFSIIDVTSYSLLTFVSVDYIVLKMETKYKRVSLDLIIIPILQYARSKEQDFNRSAQLSVKCKKALFFSGK